MRAAAARWHAISRVLPMPWGKGGNFPRGLPSKTSWRIKVGLSVVSKPRFPMKRFLTTAMTLDVECVLHVVFIVTSVPGKGTSA